MSIYTVSAYTMVNCNKLLHNIHHQGSISSARNVILTVLYNPKALQLALMARPKLHVPRIAWGTVPKFKITILI